jgi:hypothetical protein
MNVDLLVCGFTVVFDEPSEDGRPANRREDYDWFPKFAGTFAGAGQPSSGDHVLRRLRRGTG